jgi:hypothetical protein
MEIETESEQTYEPILNVGDKIELEKVLKKLKCENGYLRDHSLFMTGGGLAKKGVGHEVFLTEKGRAT